jgi:hypothetical protein
MTETNTASELESQVTFVTCYMNIYKEEPFQHKDVPWRLEQFEYIADLGVKIVVYGCSVTTPYLERMVEKYPNNVKLLTMDIPYDETPIYKLCMTEGLELPERRYHLKDTPEYMTLMNSKVEFVYDAAVKNPWGSRIFAWMDFSMAYIFGNKGETLPQLKLLSLAPFVERFMAVPGCWMPIPPNNASAIVNNIHWRFCGTFFIGDRDSILEFHRIYRENYHRFIETEKKLVWEVNIWAWLEANTDWRVQWYSSDHNDRIIVLPRELFIVNEDCNKSSLEPVAEPVTEPVAEPVAELVSSNVAVAVESDVSELVDSVIHAAVNAINEDCSNTINDE